MNRRNLGTSSGRREKAVDKSAMERMVRQNRARRKKRRKDKSISLAATMSKNVIALATSLHGIGPLIQNGTFRKRVAEIEPPWHPPRGFSLVPIEMPDFSMELLLHQNEFFSNNSLEYLKTDDSNMPEDRAGKEDTAERSRFTASWWRLHWKNEKCIPGFCRIVCKNAGRKGSSFC